MQILTAFAILITAQYHFTYAKKEAPTIYHASYLKWNKVYWQYKSKPDSFFPGNNPPPKSAGMILSGTEPFIIGGTEAFRGQWPWMVKITMDQTLNCGGTLISPNWVLTAGHCVYKVVAFELYIGAHDLSLAKEEGRVVMKSKIRRLHFNYNDEIRANDIALIKLPKKVEPSPVINFVRLPKQSDVDKDFVGVLATASGWGWTSDDGQESSVMKYISDKVVISNEECSKNYGNIIASVLCVEGNDNKSICRGDSGGPLLYQEADGKWTQIGIISFGRNESCLGYPQGFTRLTHFLSWISVQTGLKIEK